MSTALANPAKMLRLGAPRLIHSDEELAVYTTALFDLTAKAEPNPDEENAIELLTLLIDRYESERFPLPDAEPAEILRFLLAHNGLSQRDIVKELGSESTVSLVLSGKRQLNRDHISRLSRRFHISPAVFFATHSPQQGRSSTANVEFFIDKRGQGNYSVRKLGSKRASAILPTQAEAIEWAEKMNPQATIHVERVRNTKANNRDKSRTL